MQAANPGPLDAEAIERIYETIVNQCIRAQERSRNGVSEPPSEDGAAQAAAARKRDLKSRPTRTGKKRKPAKGGK